MKLLTSSLLIALTTFFIACEDSTTTPIVSDLVSLDITTKDLTIYSTDKPFPVEAVVGYNDGTSEEATSELKWKTDFDILVYDNSAIWGGVENGGESYLSATHSDFNDTTTVKIIKLTSFHISPFDSNTTGEHALIAKGNFEDNATDRLIVKNIVWSADNGALISLNNDIYTIEIQSGETNVTATMFEDTNSSSPIAPQSIVYSID